MAAASGPRRHLHQLVDQLDDRQLPQAAQALEAILRSIPGLRMPDHWPPQYADFEPLSIPGQPVSAQLIRERR